MTVWTVTVNGQVIRLDTIEQWSKRKCLRTFGCRLQRRHVVHEFIRRKLHGLRQGVRWDRITWARIKRAKFLAIKKRELRFLKKQIDTKYSQDKWSHMVRAKFATHMVITRQHIPDWDRVPDRSKYDRGFYTAHEVRSLLGEVQLTYIRGKVRHLW